MDRRLLGWVLVAVGAIAVVVSALADPLGIGTEDTGFGIRQLIGGVVGVLVAAAGLGLLYVRGESTRASTGT